MAVVQKAQAAAAVVEVAAEGGAVVKAVVVLVLVSIGCQVPLFPGVVFV